MDKWEYLVFAIETTGRTSANRFQDEEHILNSLGVWGYEVVQVMQDPDPVHSNWIKAYCKRRLND